MFVVVLRYIAELDVLDKHRQAHMEWLDTNYSKGNFIASGPQRPRYGGVILVRADSRQGVRDIISKDPFYIHQCAEFQVFEFIPTKAAEDFTKLIGV